MRESLLIECGHSHEEVDRRKYRKCVQSSHEEVDIIIGSVSKAPMRRWTGGYIDVQPLKKMTSGW